MRSWLPFPLLSLSIAILWLVLNQTTTPAHLLLGVTIGVLFPMLVRPFLPHHRHRHRPQAVLRLIGTVWIDIVRSNFAVARIVLRLGIDQRSSGFVRIPLDLRSAGGLTTLACIVTATPGTLWVDYDPVEGVLLLHVLDLIDEQEWHDIIKNRYERVLLEIFE